MKTTGGRSTWYVFVSFNRLRFSDKWAGSVFAEFEQAKDTAVFCCFILVCLFVQKFTSTRKPGKKDFIFHSRPTTYSQLWIDACYIENVRVGRLSERTFNTSQRCKASLDRQRCIQGTFKVRAKTVN